MKVQEFNVKPLVACLMLAGMLSACGGGGGDDPVVAGNTNANGNGTPTTGTDTNNGGTNNGGTNNGGTNNGGTNDGGTNNGGDTGTPAAPQDPAMPAAGTLTMVCADGSTYQCSGGTIVRTDNGVALTASGVQVYGRSTSDQATGATGLAVVRDAGLAEVRLNKDATGNVSAPKVLLSNLGLTWDGTTERPLIIETFRTTAGRLTLSSTGAVTEGALPAPTDLEFYNFATLGNKGTQANYANNVYFPRTDPSRCGTTTDCPTTESAGPTVRTGDWRTGGVQPDILTASRLHEDGDIHAGNSSTGGSLPGGTGVGVPFPGTKGFRDLSNFSYAHANLAAWASQDTVQMAEWTGGSGTNEHNKRREGVVAYGNVTDWATVPTTGQASYRGTFYGWYSATGTGDPTVFQGDATVTVNFATRQVNVTFANTASYTANPTPITALNFQTTLTGGAAGTNVAAYLTGAANNAGLTGGISARYFGPVVTTGTSGTGPAEIGGAMSLSNATGAAVIGGFIGVKQ